MLDRLRNVLDVVAIFLIDAIFILWLSNRFMWGGVLVAFGFFAAAFLAGWYARAFALRRRST